MPVRPANTIEPPHLRHVLPHSSHLPKPEPNPPRHAHQFPRKQKSCNSTRTRKDITGQQFPPHNHVVRQIYDYNTRVIDPRDEDKTRGASRQGYSPRTTRPQWPDHPHRPDTKSLRSPGYVPQPSSTPRDALEP